MIARIRRILAVCLVAALSAGCVTGGGPAPTGPEAASTATAAPIAFEPVTGIPEERTAVLAEELVSGAVSGGLAVVPRETRDAQFRIKGYFSAARSGSATEITYVWDVFDRQEARVHRIGGTESVDAALPDPWQAVTDDALRRIARRTVEELRDWLARGAPSSSGETAAAITATEAVADSGTGLSGATALLETESVLAAPPAAGGLTNISAPAGESSGPRVYIGSVAGAVSDGASALARALARHLAAAGTRGASDPAAADYLVDGEATVGPVHNGTQTVAIIWNVTAPGGGNLGTVRQVSHVPAGSLDEGWGVAAQRAAGAAAPGILALIREH